MANAVKVGNVVAVSDGRRVVNVFVFRTFADGDFRGIPETHAMYRNAINWLRAGKMDEMKAHQTEIEYMSRVYTPSELRESCQS